MLDETDMNMEFIVNNTLFKQYSFTEQQLKMLVQDRMSC